MKPPLKKSTETEVKAKAPSKRRFDNPPAPRLIREPEFAKRFTSACENNPLVPPHNFGRLGWLKDRMAEDHGEVVSTEAIRKWMAGEVKPRPDKLTLLARILGVDEAWLSMGVSPDLSPRDQKLRNAGADGAVNLIAGLIQMCGGHPAFPMPDDKRAAESSIDLYAVIKGAQYAFHVSLGRVEGDRVHFLVPPKYDDAFQIGVIYIGDFAFQLVEITHEAIEARSWRKAGKIEVELDAEAIDRARITTFAKRL